MLAAARDMNVSVGALHMAPEMEALLHTYNWVVAGAGAFLERTADIAAAAVPAV